MKIRVKGTKHYTEVSDVDVNPMDVLETIGAEFVKKEGPSSDSYVNLDDGHWYQYDSFDYHKREYNYKKSKPATEEEILFVKSLRIVKDYLK